MQFEDIITDYDLELAMLYEEKMKEEEAV